MNQSIFTYSYLQTNDGTKYTLCQERQQNKRRNYIIDNKGNCYNLPLARYMNFDYETNLIFVYDRVPVFKDYTCHISYFLDLQGNVVGQGVCDYDGRLIDVVLNEEGIDPSIAYEGFKTRLKVSIAFELYQNNGNLLEGQKKLLKRVQKQNKE